MNPHSSSTHGRFVWHELMTTDVERSVDFYSRLLGWRVEVTRKTGTPYRLIHCGRTALGGITETGASPRWLGHVSVADVDRSASQCLELGGATHVAPTDVPSVGRFAVLSDPLGATFAVFSGPDSAASDPDAMAPGCVCWNELLTPDEIKAARFYGRLFGWTDAPQVIDSLGAYHVQSLGDARVCGILKNPVETVKGTPDGWVVYFLAPELQSATEEATRLGARLFVSNLPIRDVGAFSMFADPAGAMFALFEPALSTKT
jgi:predicted enzyme related to lactoylglutathione lyase